MRLAAPLVFANAAKACTVCHTDTGAAVRSGIFNSDFGFHLFVIVLPFLVFYGIVAVVCYGLPDLLCATTRTLPRRDPAEGQTTQ
jgi:hypothetical protein